MGLFDRFKKNKKTENIIQQEKSSPDKITFKMRNDGCLQVEFYDEGAEFKKFYDTTRLLINEEPVVMAGHAVYKGSVSWYGREHGLMLNETTGKIENISAIQYRDILTEINLGLLQSDPEYTEMVMKDLLDKGRIERYLENGLREVPEHPCGKYIGGVKQTEEGYRKYFSDEVGRESHYSDVMKKKREKYRETKRKAMEEQRRAKENEIAKIQNEIDGLDK